MPPGRVIVATEHTSADGRPKLVATMSLLVGVQRPADLIVTELGVFTATGTGFRIVELAPDTDRAMVEVATDAPVEAPDPPDDGAGTAPPPRAGANSSRCERCTSNRRSPNSAHHWWRGGRGSAVPGRSAWWFSGRRGWRRLERHGGLRRRRGRR